MHRGFRKFSRNKATLQRGSTMRRNEFKISHWFRKIEFLHVVIDYHNLVIDYHTVTLHKFEFFKLVIDYPYLVIDYCTLKISSSSFSELASYRLLFLT